MFSKFCLSLIISLSLLAGSGYAQEVGNQEAEAEPIGQEAEKQTFQTLYSAEVSVGVVEENYVQARKNAISKALRQALETALKSFFGEEEYAANRKELRGIERQARRYVKSYRLLYANDNQETQTSDVKLEAAFFYNALTKALNSKGLFSGDANEKGMLVLIRELSYTSKNPRPFWQMVPISETALSQKFIEAGASIVGRKLIQNVIPEETVMKALNGDLKVAAHIALKAGADVVVLGNAASSRRDSDEEGVSIQANISLNVVSALSSSLVSARSEFAVAKNIDPLIGEMEAFDTAAGKAVQFLWPSVQKIWNPEPKEGNAGAEPSAPAPTPAPEPSPDKDLPMEIGEL